MSEKEITKKFRVDADKWVNQRAKPKKTYGHGSIVELTAEEQKINAGLIGFQLIEVEDNAKVKTEAAKNTLVAPADAIAAKDAKKVKAKSKDSKNKDLVPKK